MKYQSLQQSLYRDETSGPKATLPRQQSITKPRTLLTVSKKTRKVSNPHGPKLHNPAGTRVDYKADLRRAREFWTQAMVPHQASNIARVNSALAILRIEQNKNISRQLNAMRKSAATIISNHRHIGKELAKTCAPFSRNTRTAPKPCALKIPSGDSRNSGLGLEFVKPGESVFGSLEVDVISRSPSLKGKSLVSNSKPVQHLSHLPRSHKLMIPRTFAPKIARVKGSPPICPVAMPVGCSSNSGLALEFLSSDESIQNLFDYNAKYKQSNGHNLNSKPRKINSSKVNYQVSRMSKNGSKRTPKKALAQTSAPPSGKIATSPLRCRVPVPAAESPRSGLDLKFLKIGEFCRNEPKISKTIKTQACTFAPNVGHVKFSPSKCISAYPASNQKENGLSLSFLSLGETIFDQFQVIIATKQTLNKNKILVSKITREQSKLASKVSTLTSKVNTINTSFKNGQPHSNFKGAHTFASPTQLTKSSPRACQVPTPIYIGPGLTLSFLKPNESLFNAQIQSKNLARTSAPLTKNTKQSPRLCRLEFPRSYAKNSGILLKFLDRNENILEELFGNDAQRAPSKTFKKFSLTQGASPKSVPRISQRPDTAASSKHKIFTQKERFRV